MSPSDFVLVPAVALFTGVLLGPPKSTTKPDCIHHQGSVVCGYHCLKAHGHARCAQTPAGTCTVQSGVVACWDPPAYLSSALPEPLPRPRCVSANGQVACGYRCLISHGKPQCAETPLGVCAANNGTVLCFDPPAHVVAHHSDETPRPGCIKAFDKVACGYDCRGKDGSLRCAQTPGGVCQHHGPLGCWDPPPQTTTAFAAGATLACFAGTGGADCGHHCIGTRSGAKCGVSTKSYCFVTPRGELECTAPY